MLRKDILVGVEIARTPASIANAYRNDVEPHQPSLPSLLEKATHELFTQQRIDTGVHQRNG